MAGLHEMPVLWHVHKLQPTVVVVGDHLDHPLGSLEDHHLKPLDLEIQSYWTD